MQILFLLTRRLNTIINTLVNLDYNKKIFNFFLTRKFNTAKGFFPPDILFPILLPLCYYKASFDPRILNIINEMAHWNNFRKIHLLQSYAKCEFLGKKGICKILNFLPYSFVQDVCQTSSCRLIKRLIDFRKDSPFYLQYEIFLAILRASVCMVSNKWRTLPTEESLMHLSRILWRYRHHAVHNQNQLSFPYQLHNQFQLQNLSFKWRTW